MTNEEKEIFKAAIEAAQAQGSHAWTNIANTMTTLIDAFERTGKKSRFTTSTENPLKHLVKGQTVQTGKRVSLKEASEMNEGKNVLATSETKKPAPKRKK